MEELVKYVVENTGFNLSTILIILAIIYIGYIQKTQIDRLKSINETISQYASIFDISKVKEYVEVREDTIIDKATNIIANNDKLKEISLDVMAEKEGEFANFYIEEMGTKYDELFNLACNIIHQNRSNPKNIALILDCIPNNKDAILEKMGSLNNDVENEE